MTARKCGTCRDCARRSHAHPPHMLVILPHHHVDPTSFSHREQRPRGRGRCDGSSLLRGFGRDPGSRWRSWLRAAPGRVGALRLGVTARDRIEGRSRAGRGPPGPREDVTGTRMTPTAHPGSSWSARRCCTLERGAPTGGFRIFRVIPGLSLEPRFSVDGLPCAEGPALHMGGFQRR